MLPDAPISSVELIELASGLAIEKGESSPFVMALRRAAKEIDTLKFTAEASVKLAQRASEQSVEDRRQLSLMQAENSRLHEKNIAYRENRDRLLGQLQEYVIRGGEIPPSPLETNPGEKEKLDD